MAESSWDVEKLKEELKKHTEIRDNILQTTTRLQHAVKESQLVLMGIPDEDNVWKERCKQQQSWNQQLEAQLMQLERNLEDMKTQQEANEEPSNNTYDDMSDASMRLILKKLEKDKAELEWQIKDSEWRLDQEAAALHKAEEEKQITLTKLSQVSLAQTSTRVQKLGETSKAKDSTIPNREIQKTT